MIDTGGNRQPQDADAFPWRLLAWVGGLLFVVVPVYLIGTLAAAGPDAAQDRPRAPSAIGAWLECTAQVRGRLKAPSTAEFPAYDPDFVEPGASGLFHVVGYVDAQNAFGAQLRTPFACTTRPIEGTRDWHLVGLDFMQ